MRRKQITENLEKDPLNSLGDKLAGTKSQDEEQTNMYGETMIKIRPNKTFNLKQESMPQVEWWDEFFLPKDSETGVSVARFPTELELQEKDIYMDRITHFVQHPVPLRNE